MTEAEYVAEMEFLEQMLGALHLQVNAIADREAAATAAQHPVPYSNAALTAAKARLIVNGGAKPGQCGGVKAGHLRQALADMARAPIGALAISRW